MKSMYGFAFVPFLFMEGHFRLGACKLNLDMQIADIVQVYCYYIFVWGGLPKIVCTFEGGGRTK